MVERLSKLNDGLARKIASRNEYDRTIQETEVRAATSQTPAQHRST